MNVTSFMRAQHCHKQTCICAVQQGAEEDHQPKTFLGQNVTSLLFLPQESSLMFYKGEEEKHACTANVLPFNVIKSLYVDNERTTSLCSIHLVYIKALGLIQVHVYMDLPSTSGTPAGIVTALMPGSLLSIPLMLYCLTGISRCLIESYGLTLQ